MQVFKVICHLLLTIWTLDWQQVKGNDGSSVGIPDILSVRAVFHLLPEYMAGHTFVKVIQKFKVVCFLKLLDDFNKQKLSVFLCFLCWVLVHNKFASVFHITIVKNYITRIICYDFVISWRSEGEVIILYNSY
jgi:hypothetical protein